MDGLLAGMHRRMTDEPWGVTEGSPMNEGSDNSAVPPGRVGERRAADGTDTSSEGSGALPWGEDEERQPGSADLGVGQPDLGPDEAVSGRTPRRQPADTRAAEQAHGGSMAPGLVDETGHLIAEPAAPAQST